MKTVYFARHAKSDWNQPGVSDFDRPLNKRGYIDSSAMAIKIQPGSCVEKIISSDAVRALETATEYKNHLTPDSAIIQNHALYLASHLDIAKVLQSTPDEYSSVMVVGHNPGMSDVVNYFIEQSVNDMPTCSVAIIQFDVKGWSELKGQSGHLQAFETPK